jgi:hypothetical protein
LHRNVQRQNAMQRIKGFGNGEIARQVPSLAKNCMTWQNWPRSPETRGDAVKMPYTRLEIAQHAEKLGRSPRTLRRGITRGFDPDDPESVEKFLAESQRKKNNVRSTLELAD